MTKFNLHRLRRQICTALIITLCIMIASCASRPINSNEITGSLETNLKKLDLENSFAFIHDADEFYFARILLSEEGYKCGFFVGFKNGQFKYRFPAYRVAELSKIYDEKVPIRTKKARALEKLDSFKIENQRCSPEISEREKTVGERIGDVLAGVLYAPLIPIGFIGMVTFGAGDTIQSFKDSILERKMDQLRLRRSLTDVKTLLNRDMTFYRAGSHDLYTIDYGYYRRLVLIFENDRLTGIIRGSTSEVPASK